MDNSGIATVTCATTGAGLLPLARKWAMSDAVRVDSGPKRTQRSPTATPRGRAALDAARRGWSVIPLHNASSGRCSCADQSCPAPGKHPRIAWKRYMREAADIAQVRQWWRRWPEANVGVITGAVSGLVVLDVDPRNCGDKSLAELEDIHGPVHPTVESLTGGGGQHLYFRHPGTVVPCGSVAPGLDVKGDGGLVVSPPSAHVSGRDYVWEAGCSPDEALLADLPPWLEGVGRESAPAPSLAGRSEREVSLRTEGEQAEFAALWATIGLELRPGDRNYLCPFHSDHHPSLHIDAEGCRFYCFGCGRGGGSGRLRRLVDGPRRPLPSRDKGLADLLTPWTAGPVTVPDGSEVHVVGESAYQDALLELTGGRRLYGGVRMESVARLVPEPGNPADPGAISVTIAGRTVGYLSRPDATRYRDTVAAAIDQSGEASCMALIVGGWEREHGDVGLFGVRLHLAATGAISSRVSPPPL